MRDKVLGNYQTWLPNLLASYIAVKIKKTILQKNRQ